MSTLPLLLPHLLCKYCQRLPIMQYKQLQKFSRHRLQLCGQLHQRGQCGLQSLLQPDAGLSYLQHFYYLHCLHPGFLRPTLHLLHYFRNLRLLQLCLRLHQHLSHKRHPNLHKLQHHRTPRTHVHLRLRLHIWDKHNG